VALHDGNTCRYFDVAGMAVTRGAAFDDFYASQHVDAFARALQVSVQRAGAALL